MNEAASKAALRCLTCGSVDDGKSTLIGRLLYEQELLPDDQLAALAHASRAHGTTGKDLDLSLLLDGLEAEQEQNITIDVAYRYFSTKRRMFVVADAPGHAQYTHNMVTAASTADLAILLVDATKGISQQTRRHAAIASLLGIKHVALIVNKMDIVGFEQSLFERIVAEFRSATASLDFTSLQAIPVSALRGDNISGPSSNTLWYLGPSLLSHLEDVDAAETSTDKPFRFSVQWVNRPTSDFRGYAGTIASGSIAVGDPIIVAHAERGSRIARIVTADGDRRSACAGDAVTLVLDDEIDLARGDLLSAPRSKPYVGDRFIARLVWMDDQPLQLGRSYLLKIGTMIVPATIVRVMDTTDIDTLAPLKGEPLQAGDIGLCEVATTGRIAFDAFRDNRKTGAFILVDRSTNATSAAGMIERSIERASNVVRHEHIVPAQRRAALKRQRPAVLWFTGLSGAGKSTIANLVEARLCERQLHTMLLDGDNLRHGLCNDLGFTPEARSENIRRVAEVAKLMTEAGLVVLCSFISPFRAERRMARDIIGPESFFEIFVDTPLSVCIERDPKGLYQRALAGEIRDFTGVGQAYERPDAPELTIGRNAATADIDADYVLTQLLARFAMITGTEK